MNNTPTLEILFIILAIVTVPYLIGKIRDRNAPKTPPDNTRNYSNSEHRVESLNKYPQSTSQKKSPHPDPKPKQPTQISRRTPKTPAASNSSEKQLTRKCDACGAPIPLGSGNLPEIHCRYCGTPIKDADKIILETLQEQNRQKELELEITREREATKRREMEIQIERERINPPKPTQETITRSSQNSGCVKRGCISILIYGIIIIVFIALITAPLRK